MKFKRRPLIAAILNFFVWGLGYVYNGKRIVFGILLVAGSISMAALSLTVPQEAVNQVSTLLLMPSLVISLAFAYDALLECRELRKPRKPEWEM
ncbi:MAG: hypothetical protein HYW25_00815 [Candidatus Aenigmarchaeota archaeon]|nr:hypothetical protein [Candidatus Aenigmarchaeota archaeon]